MKKWNQAINSIMITSVSILSIDETMSDLAKLDYGEYAESESETSDWTVRYKDK